MGMLDGPSISDLSGFVVMCGGFKASIPWKPVRSAENFVGFASLHTTFFKFASAAAGAWVVAAYIAEGVIFRLYISR